MRPAGLFVLCLMLRSGVPALAAEQEVRFDGGTELLVMPSAGLSYGLAPIPMLVLEAGARWQLVASGGRFWAMPKLVLGSVANRFTMGAGLEVGWIDSGGAGGIFFRGDGAIYSVRIEAAGYEHRFDGGLALSAALGVGIGLSGPRFCVIDCHPQDLDSQWRGALFPQLRLSVGYWF